MAERQLKASWTDVDALDTVFADHAFLAQINDQYFLTFGQTNVPVLATEDSAAGSATIRPVARLMIPHEAFKRIVKLLEENATTAKREKKP